jgi:predicted dehydrogenase
MTRSSSPSSTLAIGVIGCGQIAQAVHLPILARLPGVRVTALADIDATRLSQAGARAPHAARFSDYTRLLATAAVDAVVVCVPPALHAEVAIAALQADKHVYLEKPLATTVEDGERVCEAWRRAGRVGMIGFNYRFNRLYRQARSHVCDDRIGPVVAVRSVFATTSDGLPDWKRARSSGGGALLDLASHDIDLVQFVLGEEVVEVFAEVRSLESEGDSAVLQMRLVSGIPAQIFVALGTAEEAVFEVYGQRGKVTVNRYQSLAARVSGARVHGRLRRLWNSAMAVRELPYFVQRLRAEAHEPSFAAGLAHFFGAIRGRHRACPDFLDGYRSLSVVAAAEESARTGRPAPTDLPESTPAAAEQPGCCSQTAPVPPGPAPDRGAADVVPSHDLRSELA